MADLKQVEAAFLKADAAGDTESARVLAGEVRRLRAAAAPSGAASAGGMSDETRATLLASKPVDRGGEVKRSAMEELQHQYGNLAAGAFRGAGSIGATLLYPYDALRDALDGGARPKLSDLITGNKPLSRNQQRRADMDAALESLGNDTGSLAFQGGKLGAEVAGTAGVGPLLRGAATAVPAVAARAPGLIEAIGSAGMRGGQGGAAANALTRVAGGAITGGASAGLVSPGDAGAGAGVGAVLPSALRGSGALARSAAGAVRGVVEPFTEAGRTAISGRTLARFGVTPADVAGLSSAPTATGARLSLAEQIARPEGAAGAARLQDALQSLDPQIAGRMVAREAENNAARVNRLQELAGQDGGREFALAERAGTTGPMYEDAFRMAADGRQLTAEQTRAMQTLQRAPAIQAAMADARANASNAGANVGPSNASGSVEGLHNVKLALDAAITRARNPANPAGQATLEGLQAAQRRLVGFIESISPEYANARGVYAQMSTPINQMDVAGELLRRGTANTADLAGTPRLMPNALLGALRDEPGLIRRATGRDLGNSLQRLLEPDQYRTVRAIADEVDRGAAVARAGNGPGSATAQRLASTNLLQQMGIPEGLSTNPLVQTVMRPVQFGAQLAEPRIQQQLLEIIQNPALAEEALRRATPAQRVQLQRLISSGASGAARLAPLTATDR